MIHVRAWKGSLPNELVKEDPTLQITISGVDELTKLYGLLQRSLNCAPEFGKDWFALSDKLEQFLASLPK